MRVCSIALCDPYRLHLLVGFSRRTGIDELPRFINVLRGEMSIIGPRPQPIVQTEQYSELLAQLAAPSTPLTAGLPNRQLGFAKHRGAGKRR